MIVAAPLVALFGDAAPEAWLVVARAGALTAVLLAFGLGRRVAGRGAAGAAAGAAASLGVLLAPGFIEHAAAGDAEGAVTASLLLALGAVLDGRLRRAFAWGVLAALLRVEVWPLLAALGLALALRDPRARPAVAAAFVGIGALWFVPELLSSGDIWRSAARARAPNPGAPALADAPAAASLATAAAMASPVAWLGLLVAGVLAARSLVPAPRGALLVGGAGAAWIAIVALMSESGFSGEARYLLPGVALVAVAGPAALLSAGWARRLTPAPTRLGRAVPAALAAALVSLALVATAVERAPRLATHRLELARSATVAADLQRAVARAGGAGRIVRCGRPYTRRFTGPVVAWTLEVPKRVVAFGAERPGVAFLSARRTGETATPPRPGRPTWVVRAGAWAIAGACSPSLAQSGHRSN